MKKLAVTLAAVTVLSLGAGGCTSPDDSSDSTTTTIALLVVPPEVGKAAAAAVAHLEAAGLRGNVVEAPSVNFAAGQVISQSPVQGTEVPKGTVIRLTVSNGPP